MKLTMLSLSLVTLLSGCVIYVDKGHAGDLQFEQQQLQLDAAQLTALSADTGAGKLEIVGEANRSQIEVVAAVHYRKKEDIRFSLKRSGDKAVLEAGFDSNISYGNSPYMDVVVKVPQHFALQLDDGSGDTEIRGLQGDLDIKDGSGDLAIYGGANATVEDGSGDLTIRGLTGKLLLDDGSGDAQIKQIAADVTIDDGSGNLTIENIGGVVTVDDGSGDIRIDGAAGVTIIDSGSGGLKLNNVNGPVKLDD